MKLQIPKAFKEWHAKKLLDWAEKKSAPKKRFVSASRFLVLRERVNKQRKTGFAFKAKKSIRQFILRNSITFKYRKFIKQYHSTVRSLKIIRESQRRSSEMYYEFSRAPEGTDIEYLYFRSMEMFHIEDFQQLKDGLLKLFPSLEKSWTDSDFEGEFKSATINETGSWRQLGYIVRENSYPLIALDVHRVMPHLPKEIKYIYVQWHKIITSVFVITFDVYLNDEPTNRLKELHNRRYLSAIRLIKW